MYSIEFTKAAAKALASMPRNTRDLVKAKIVALAADPSDVGNVKKLVGRPGYRLRVGTASAGRAKIAPATDHRLSPQITT